MKKIVSILVSLSLAVCLAAPSALAQSASEVVAKVLSSMPAGDAAAFDTQMAALSAAAPATVGELAKLLKPAAAGVKNNLVEYALTGLPAYAGSHPEVLEKVCQGFADAIGNAGNTEVKSFLMERLRLIATQSCADTFAAQVSDPAVAAIALGALSDIPGTEDMLLGMVKDAAADKTLLAAAVAKKGLSAAEPYLQQWASEGEGYEGDALCSALAKIGSASSLKTLAEKNLPACAALAVKLAGEGKNSKAVAKAAKALLSSDASFLKSAGAEALMKNNPATVYKTLKNALKSEDGQFRDAVLDDATEILGAASLVPMLTGKFASFSDDAKVDVLNWIGNNKIQSATSLLASLLTPGTESASVGTAVRTAAIEAAGKIGGEKLGKLLIGQLGATDSAASQAAMTALKSFSGDLSGDLLSALQTTGNPEALMKLAAARSMAAAAPAFLTRFQEGDASVAPFLAGVVGEKDIPVVGKLLGTAKDHVGDLQEALRSAIHTQDADTQYATVKALQEKADIPENFFKVLSWTGTDAAAADLAALFAASTGTAKQEALQGLLSIDNYAAAPALMKAAKEDASVAEAALSRFVDLTQAYAPSDGKKYTDLSQVLSLAGTKALKDKALGALATLPTMKSFLLSGKFLGDKESSYAAANAVKNIAAKTAEEINTPDYIALLKKASDVFASTGNSDDGYAVSEIATLLEKAPAPVAPSTLTAQEKRQGFEMLFDGTSLDRWQGDKESYTPVNGAILVSSNGGGTGNLYTDKEYRNFVFRFEFCFLREGVNNGVGIRTPMGVDAAYHGMCECQILDHDAPEYAGWLREYQVHGSVYGVVPAKRLVHKPLGEWSTEEIRVEGDRIKVTVNGEVIVDANIRKACKGHNVAPDGSNENPYTVDHRNHPGMFNRKGYVSFCGHGEGLKIRNVRILDLGDK